MKRLEKFTARWSGVLSIVVGAAFLGSGLMSITMKPPIAMTGVTLLAALAGAKARSMRRGLIFGACVGLIGGAAIVFALDHVRVQKAAAHPPTTNPAWQFRPQWTVPEDEIAAIGATTFLMSLSAAGVFAWAAKRRRDLMG
ncbi:MAG: hypothetical protein NT031_15090 [Planctomycetota bacterium]|nr:hypothetical protein [Planctomycetota bacterium]